MGVVWSIFVGIVMVIVLIAVFGNMHDSSNDNQCTNNGFANGYSP